MKPHAGALLVFLIAGAVFFPSAKPAAGFETWVADALKKGSRVVLNSTAAVATPVPSAALLLGTGIICLVGLRRRSRPQA